MTGSVAGSAHNCYFFAFCEKAKQFQICPKTLLGCAYSFIHFFRTYRSHFAIVCKLLQKLNISTDLDMH